MARTGRLTFLALVAFLAATFLTPTWSVRGAERAKFTVHAGETVVTDLGEIAVEITATEDTIVYLSLEDGALYSTLEPHPDAPEAPYVVVTVLPGNQVLFRGVVAQKILACVIMTETGHTEL